MVYTPVYKYVTSVHMGNFALVPKRAQDLKILYMLAEIYGGTRDTEVDRKFELSGYGFSFPTEEGRDSFEEFVKDIGYRVGGIQ